MFSSNFGRFSSVEWTPDQEQDYIDPSRARIQADEGYIESTSAYNFQPDWYACYAASGVFYGQCDSGRLMVRNSFVKVPEEQTFEPFAHLDNEKELDASGRPIMTTTLVDSGSGQRVDVECDAETTAQLFNDTGSYGIDSCSPLTFDYFGRFGYFRTDRVEFDEGYGASEIGRRFYANHFNVWQTAFDEEGNSLPLDERAPKPIVYHLNPEYPRDMVDAATEVERQWDEAFKETIRVAKGYDTIGQVEEELAALYDGDTRMFKIEHNGCMPNMVTSWLGEHGDTMGEDVDVDGLDIDGIVENWASKSKVTQGSLEEQLWGLSIPALKRMCAELEYATESRPQESRFVWQREGDLRYSFFSWVEEQINGWAGYGPSSADPITGEIISGGAHINGTYIRTVSTYASDLVRYLNGDLDIEDVAYGAHAREVLTQKKDHMRETMAQTLSSEGKRKVNAQANPSINGYQQSGSFDGSIDFDSLPPVFAREGIKKIAQGANVAVKASIEAEKQNTFVTDALSSPEVKSMLMADPMMYQTVEALANERLIQSGGELTEEDRELAYLSIQAPHLQLWRNDAASRQFASNSILTANDIDRALETLITYDGVANHFEDMDREEIIDYFRKQLTVGTQLHEVGHTVGLRHNFSASLDALNYHPEFWMVQKAIVEGKITEEDATRLTADQLEEILGDEFDAERGYKYVNEAEFRLASVMDYTGDLTGRFAGLGNYDQAAINFVYGKKVQRWKPEVTNDLKANLDTALFLNSGYDKLPLIFSGTDTSKPEKERLLKGIDTILNGREWVSIDEARQELREGIAQNTKRLKEGSFSSTSRPFQRVEVPYNFCSDDRSDFQLGCDVFDWGSSYREIVNHSFNTYRQLSNFYRFKRQRMHNYGETINGYWSFVLRTLFAAQRPFRFYSFYRVWDLGAYTDNLREAAIDSINFYGEVLATPNAGRHCLYTKDKGQQRINSDFFRDISNTYVPANFEIEGVDCENAINVLPGVGQRFGYDLTDEYGFRINYVGSFIDKLAASQALFLVQANNLFNQFLTDTRATNLSFWMLYKKEMLGQLRAIVLNDYTEFGYVHDQATTAANGNTALGVYQPPMMVDRDAFTHGVPHVQENKPRIYTPLSFNHEFNVLFYGLIYNSSYQDRVQDFSSYLRIVVGDRLAEDFGESELHEFINPETGQRYLAPQTEDGGSITVELVQWANELKAQWLAAQNDERQLQDMFDAERDAFDAARAPTEPAFTSGRCQDEASRGVNVELDDVCIAMLEFEEAKGISNSRSEQIQDIVAKMEMIRWMWGYLGPYVRN